MASPIAKVAPNDTLAPSPTNVTHTAQQLINELSESLNVNGEEFAHEEFDAKAFTSAIMKTNMLTQHLGKLSLSINSLDKEIREQVSFHHEDLLHQAIKIETLEEMLDMVQTRISSLKSTSERLRVKISSPYNELSSRIMQLSRLQAACDMLRRIKGILHHSAKLRVHHTQNGAKDIVKSAQCLNELDFLLKNFDAAGIEVIEKDVLFASRTRHEVIEQAQVILDKSLAHHDQSQIGTALQVFYSLGILTERLVDALKKNEKNFHKLASDLLNTTNLTLLTTNNSSSTSHLHASQSAVTFGGQQQFPGRVNMPNVGSMSQFRAQLWTNVEKLMDALYDSCSQIVQLQQILEKKKDSLTNLFYMDELDFSVLGPTKMYVATSNDSDDVSFYDTVCAAIGGYHASSNSSSTSADQFNAKRSIEFLYEQWRLLTVTLNGSIVAACNQSNYIKQTFQNEYPKLLKLQNDLWLRLVQMSPLIDRYRYPSDHSSGALSSTSTSSKTTREVNKQTIGFQSSYELLRKCFTDLENHYLNQSLSRLFDPINLIFSQSADKPINRSDIDTYLKGVQSQLQTLQYDVFNAAGIGKQTPKRFGNDIVQTIQQSKTFSSSFTDKIVANICKSIQMYANKAEYVLTSLNADMRQTFSASSSSIPVSSGGSGGINTLGIFGGGFSSLPNQIQTKNLDYVNVTQELHDQMAAMFASSDYKLNDKLTAKLSTTLKGLSTFQENALNPIIQSASECILAILITMHQEDFDNPISQTCSLYVKELQQVLQRICRDYLHLYTCKHILNAHLIRLAQRCIDLFIRHASIMRPMSDRARLRLVNDSQQIEQIIQSTLCSKLTDLGVAYKQLKAFRHLVQLGSPFSSRTDDTGNQTVENNSSSSSVVVDDSIYSPIIAESLPYHVILHYLFSYGPVEFKSPHQSLDWPISAYSEWLDKHENERERLYVIRNCLEAYVNMVRQKNEKKFADIYPLMFRLLEKGIQSLQNTNA